MQIPTGRDIYLEVDGRRIAVVQSYQATTKKQSESVEAFGQTDAVATVPGKVTHHIRLTKVLPLASASDVDFYNLSNFSLMIVKPDSRIVYSGCQWEHIAENGDVNRPCFQEVTLLAARRLVLGNSR